MDHLYELRALVERHGQEGPTETAVGGLTLYVETDLSVVTYVVHQPVLALILGGAKRTVLGGRIFDIVPGDYVAVSVDLPATGQVTQAPYSAVTLDLDLGMLASLIAEPMTPQGAPPAWRSTTLGPICLMRCGDWSGCSTGRRTLQSLRP
ncbi:AraC family transcriptional regulator [Paraburkholderia kirstenboschensis]|uniref:AraC family transcriptional regulator n=1 Tax=Paraburkholderia kirstenboschensis TaxID=1245436 RepID=A0ABZ0ED51_9BURK|nr:AraC family transcriptional regulator [Paraburkholderia kirstenboschensis]WOD14444.1 AraC family transcriptional regulator [Paraburkholderia kirstenboschensis]